MISIIFYPSRRPHLANHPPSTCLLCPLLPDLPSPLQCGDILYEWPLIKLSFFEKFDVTHGVIRVPAPSLNFRSPTLGKVSVDPSFNLETLLMFF